MIRIKALLPLAFLLVATTANAQAILATANGRNFTVNDLTPDAHANWEKRDLTYADERRRLLTDMVTDIVVETEAKARNMTTAQLVAEQTQRIPDPTDLQISAVYEANRDALGNKPLPEVRKEIVAYLRRDPEQARLAQYVDELATKYKIDYGKDVNAPDLKPTDVLFTLAAKTVTDQEFETKNRFQIYDAKANPIDDVNADLESTILTYLVQTDAAVANLDQQAYTAREITDKMKLHTDEERGDLESVMKRRLFAKYKVKFMMNPPPPIVQKISPDDDPATGPLNAPVTVVMFADFQCSACSRTEPVLKHVLAEYPGKVRFVMRDYPLETLHENAFIAALAANAANAQGKFFEYSEILFHNQNALDAESLKKYAAQIGLNVQQFTVDFNSEKAKAEVRKDMADGQSYGITGTPTIFVNGVKVRRLSAEDFREAIDNALKTSMSPAARTAARR
jgi:protein-disulfide isomerase